MVIFLGAMAYLVSALLTGALAQSSTDVQQFRNFKPTEDMATRLMEGLLGETYTSPLTAGIGSSTIFGAVFLVFNVIVFTVGSGFATYGVVSGIVATAHEGKVLGQRMSPIWMPIRMVTGIGSLIPAFGGFSLSQVVMILATSWGISFGNFAYDKALQAATSSATLVNASFSRVDPGKDPNAMAQALFNQRLCEISYKKREDDMRAEGLVMPPDDVLKEYPYVDGSARGATVGRTLGTKLDPSACYSVGMKRKTATNGIVDTGRSSFGMGFRSGAVDYKSIAESAWDGYATNFPILLTRVYALADAYQAKIDLQKGAVEKPTDEIRAAGIVFGGSVQIADVNRKNISSEALTNMGKYGFFSAGSYYSTHAEVNAAVLQAANVTEFRIRGPNAPKIASGSYGEDRGFNENTDQFGRPSGFCIGSIGKQNDTGNCSWGQKIVSLIADAGTAGAGGASTVVDPIIALKNIGDYMMVTGEGILAASAIMNRRGEKESEKPGLASRAVSAVVSYIPVVGSLVSMAGDLVAAIGTMAPYIGGLLFAIGALCAIYLPMVPFINWVSGLTQYCCIVVESFAAAPLWSFAHLQAEGDGMGQRTEKGYLYILNLLFRPILMIVGFFAASALVILLGSLVFQMFIPVMASAQGNSVTGIFSIIGYVFLLFVMMSTMISAFFNLIMELADDAIGWVGGIGRSNIGRDTEGKVHNLFMAGGRFGAGGVDRMLPRQAPNPTLKRPTS